MACPECKVHPANGHLFGCSVAAAIAARRIQEHELATRDTSPVTAAARDA